MSGNRGYGGDCYAGRVIPDQRCDDARGLLMESARSLGLLGEQHSQYSLRAQTHTLLLSWQSQMIGCVTGSKACRLQMSTVAVRIARLLTPLVNEQDKGALLPSRHVRLAVAVAGVYMRACVRACVGCRFFGWIHASVHDGGTAPVCPETADRVSLPALTVLFCTLPNRSRTLIWCSQTPHLRCLTWLRRQTVRPHCSLLLARAWR